MRSSNELCYSLRHIFPSLIDCPSSRQVGHARRDPCCAELSGFTRQGEPSQLLHALQTVGGVSLIWVRRVQNGCRLICLRSSSCRLAASASSA